MPINIFALKEISISKNIYGINMGKGRWNGCRWNGWTLEWMPLEWMDVGMDPVGMDGRWNGRRWNGWTLEWMPLEWMDVGMDSETIYTIAELMFRKKMKEKKNTFMNNFLNFILWSWCQR